MKLEINYQSIMQLAKYFIQLDAATNLPITFTQRRGLKSLVKTLKSEVEVFEEHFQMLVDKYCEKNDGQYVTDENGNYKIKIEEKEECYAAIEELNNAIVKIEFYDFQLPAQYFENMVCDNTVYEIIESNFIQ